jgi:hypothetical protein
MTETYVYIYIINDRNFMCNQSRCSRLYTGMHEDLNEEMNRQE